MKNSNNPLTRSVLSSWSHFRSPSDPHFRQRMKGNLPSALALLALMTNWCKRSIFKAQLTYMAFRFNEKLVVHVVKQNSGCVSARKKTTLPTLSLKKAHLSLMDMCLAVIMSLSSSSSSGWNRPAVCPLPSVCASAAGGWHTVLGEPDVALDVTTVDSGSSVSTSRQAHTNEWVKSITWQQLRKC